MSKRILILSDSLALPRSQPEVCSYENTWPELLKGKGFTIHQVSFGGGTSVDLLSQVLYHKSFNPDIVILQVGIVDCAPRFMTKLELSIARKMGILGRILIKALNRKSIKRLRKINYVGPIEFSNNIRKICESFDRTPVFVLGILDAGEKYEKILPGVSKRISQYNKILSTYGLFISVEDFDRRGIMTDHHHLNEFGHRQIEKKILNNINA
ncbi:SGNH/GDSL hydrolase family protein [Sphingobacterium sp. NGMCC 1.201703]|uniref:SGNH/GDSL hydrolase family protein n=1 Tax=Sphingobacterium sp. NGMCC 1.201703 TaxID=3388657 RepID=UPI0039FBD2C9